MQTRDLQLKHSFKVVLGNRRSQAAEMVLKPGECEGGPENRHRGSDQWLWVVSGQGEAIIERQTVRLKKGTMLLIERGEAHQIRNTGRTSLRTLNLYVPPAYSAQGGELPAGKN